MHARMTELDLDPSRIDDAVRRLEEQDVPQWRSLDGFKGFTLLVDRASGHVAGVSFWESRDAMEAAEEAVAPSRRAAAEVGGATGEPQVSLYEVALDVMD